MYIKEPLVYDALAGVVIYMGLFYRLDILVLAAVMALGNASAKSASLRK